jgi:outer membrane receptor for monomeric catechols
MTSQTANAINIAVSKQPKDEFVTRWSASLGIQRWRSRTHKTNSFFPTLPVFDASEKVAKSMRFPTKKAVKPGRQKPAVSAAQKQDDERRQKPAVGNSGEIRRLRIVRFEY